MVISFEMTTRVRFSVFLIMYLNLQCNAYLVVMEKTEVQICQEHQRGMADHLHSFKPLENNIVDILMMHTREILVMKNSRLRV